MSQFGGIKIGATVGLAASTCSESDRRAEQVYVRLSDAAMDDRGSHPIEVDAWVGYSSVGRFRVTRPQARELIPLLLAALEQTEVDR